MNQFLYQTYEDDMAWCRIGERTGVAGERFSEGCFTCGLKDERETAFQTVVKGRGNHKDGVTFAELLLSGSIDSERFTLTFTNPDGNPIRQIQSTFQVYIMEASWVGQTGSVLEQRSHCLQDPVWGARRGTHRLYLPAGKHWRYLSAPRHAPQTPTGQRRTQFSSDTVGEPC